jgi:hypothetical protein
MWRLAIEHFPDFRCRGIDNLVKGPKDSVENRSFALVVE